MYEHVFVSHFLSLSFAFAFYLPWWYKKGLIYIQKKSLLNNKLSNLINFICNIELHHSYSINFTVMIHLRWLVTLTIFQLKLRLPQKFMCHLDTLAMDYCVSRAWDWAKHENFDWFLQIKLKHLWYVFVCVHLQMANIRFHSIYADAVTAILSFSIIQWWYTKVKSVSKYMQTHSNGIKLIIITSE